MAYSRKSFGELLGNLPKSLGRFLKFWVDGVLDTKKPDCSVSFRLVGMAKQSLIKSFPVGLGAACLPINYRQASFNRQGGDLYLALHG
jgi:hypothetical protein